MADQHDFTRRELIQISAAAAVAAGTQAGQASEPSPKFFTKDEFAMVDELAELIIPADAHSPGTRAAEVASYIDARLAEAFEERLKQRWRECLKRVDALSHQIYGRPFMQGTQDQRVAVLTRMAKNEDNPQTPEEHFFAELKSHTAWAYYTSKIGIHQEMQYKGNVPVEEFVGYEVK